MKYCNNCGNATDDNAIFCPHCGARTNGEKSHVNFNPYGGFGGYGYQPYYDTKGSALLAVLSFLFWQAGVIIWLFCRQTRPGKARSAAKGALSSACLGIPIIGLVLWIIWKDDYSKKDYAKVAGISAIVGVVLYAAIIALSAVVGMLGVDVGEYAIPFGEMAAMINLYR